MKKILGLIVLFVALLSVPFYASAETVSITAGSLGYTPQIVTFSPVTLNNLGPQSATGSSTMQVVDNRGSSVGWSVSLSATDPVSAPIQDPTSDGGTGSYTVTMPASAISVSGTPFTSSAGQPVDATNGPLFTNKTLSNSPQAIADAAPGFGAGVYASNLTFNLTIPHTVTVASISGTGSKFNVGSVVGLPATTFTTTLTYTTAAGF